MRLLSNYGVTASLEFPTLGAATAAGVLGTPLLYSWWNARTAYLRALSNWSLCGG